MDLRYYLDPDTNLPHIYGHGVTEEEVEYVLRSAGGDAPAGNDARMKIGQTEAGRYLQDSPDSDGDGVFVITAYELGDKAKKAFRRRRRRRGK